MSKILAALTIVFLFRGAAALISRNKRGSGPTIVPLTNMEKKGILLHHNDLRRLSRSSNMRYMTWDSELEQLAIGYSKKCHLAHNKERKHSKGWSVGENIYATSRKMLGQHVVEAIQSWYDEKKDFTFRTRTCTPNKVCGHYTQIVWATTFKIGCALVDCQYLTGVDWNSRGSMFLCNYATAGNIVYGSPRKLMPIFEPGPPCLKCDKDDYCKEHLCGNKERDVTTEDFSDNNANKERDVTTEDCLDNNDASSDTGLIVGMTVLAIIVMILIAFVIYRERNRISVKLGRWKTRSNNSVRFRNQNTPVASAQNTPRHSLTGLHGIQKLTTADIGNPIEKVKATERGFQSSSSSAPTTLRHIYVKGTATPPKMPPPVPPPSYRKR